MSHGNSREQTSDNTRNCGGVCLFSQNKTTSWAIDSEPIRARRIIGKQLEIFPDRARSHSLLRGHVTAHNELIPARINERATLQHFLTSEGNSALLPANVDRRRPLERGLMNFQLQTFQLYNKSLKEWLRETKLTVSLTASH